MFNRPLEPKEIREWMAKVINGLAAVVDALTAATGVPSSVLEATVEWPQPLVVVVQGDADAETLATALRAAMTLPSLAAEDIPAETLGPVTVETTAIAPDTRGAGDNKPISKRDKK